MKWHREVYVRLLLATSLPGFLAIILFYHGLKSWQDRVWQESLLDRSHALAYQLAVTSPAAGLPLESAGLRLWLRQVRAAHPRLRGIAIWSPEQQLLASEGRLEHSPGADVAIDDALAVSGSVFAVGVPVAKQPVWSEPVGAGTGSVLGHVWMEWSWEAGQDTGLGALWRLAPTGLWLAWLGVAFGSCWAVTRLTKALLSIADVVSALCRGEVQRRVSLVDAGPLAPLANGINQVAQELAHEELWWQKRLQHETQVLQQQKEEAERCARLDPLTGLWNRRALVQLTQLELDKSGQGVRSPLVLLALDLDHFKAINDNHGHAGGDAVLAQFALLLLQELRVVDIVARIGGEEFVVILPDTGRDQALLVAERIRCAVEHNPARLGVSSVQYTVSIGVAAFAEQSPALEDALAQADMALYRAKREGRNRVVWGQGLNRDGPRL